MNFFKNCLVSLIAGSMVFTLCGCHGKDEVALTVNDTPITSALYLNALVECDSEAKQRVDEQLAESSNENQAQIQEETDYYAQKIDGVNYVEYVKKNAIDRCKEYVFYQKLLDDGVIKLTKEKKEEAEMYASYYWDYYGASALFEANGVSLDTYKKAYLYSYCANEYFTSLYGKGGEKEVPAKDIKETLLEKYVLVYSLSTSYTEETTDAEKKQAKAQFNNYYKRLKNGEDFKVIYNEYNNIKEEQKAEENKDGPKDQLATVLGDNDTSYASTDFQKVFDMKQGEVKLITGEDNSGYTIYIKLDITKDKYYLENLTDSILRLLKQDEFEKSVDKKVVDYSVKENGYAIRRLKVKKIKYPNA